MSPATKAFLSAKINWMWNTGLNEYDEMATSSSMSCFFCCCCSYIKNDSNKWEWIKMCVCVWASARVYVINATELLRRTSLQTETILMTWSSHVHHPSFWHLLHSIFSGWFFLLSDAHENKSSKDIPKISNIVGPIYKTHWFFSPSSCHQ